MGSKYNNINLKLPWEGKVLKNIKDIKNPKLTWEEKVLKNIKTIKNLKLTWEDSFPQSRNPGYRSTGYE